MLLTEKKRALYSEAFKDINNQLHDAFSQIKEEFEDHLVAINENTNEIQSNYEVISEIDQKLNKLSERLDRIEFFLQKEGLETEEKQEFKPVRLSKREQEVFLVMYILCPFPCPMLLHNEDQIQVDSYNHFFSYILHNNSFFVSLLYK